MPKTPAPTGLQLIFGIDPGSKGGVCAMQVGRTISSDAAVMDVVMSPIKDEYALSDFLKRCLSGMSHDQQVVAYVELVHSMPKQGVRSTFTFGKNFGIILGELAVFGIRVFLVNPQKWQQAVGAPARNRVTIKGKTKTGKPKTKAEPQSQWKKRLLQFAKQQFPNLANQLTLFTCDALLIAEYGRQRQMWKGLGGKV